MRRLIGVAAIAIGCGPVVPFDDGTSSADTGNPTRTDSGRETGPDGEADGRPPDPSAPGDATVEPDTGIGEDGPIVTLDSSGPVPTSCGDGVLDPDEACDDGNEDDGDGCTISCTLTVELAWTWSYDGAVSSFDSANDVIVGPDGTIYVVGITRVTAGPSDVWLQQLSPDGEPGWTWTWDGAESLADVGAALAWTPDGMIAIVGTTESMATGDDILVLLVEPTMPALVWAQVFDGPGSGPGEYDEVDAGHDIAIDPSGNVVVAGTVRVGTGDYDAWVGELSPIDGALAWAQQRDAGPSDVAHAVYVRATGDVVLLVEHDAERASFTTYFGDDGSIPGIEIDHGFAARDMALRGDGGIALAGVDDPEDYGFDLVVASLDDGLNQWWEQHDGADHSDDAIGVAAGPNSEVVAVGHRGVSGEQGNAWIRVHRDDGTRLWSDTYDGPASLEDEFSAAAFTPDGAVIAVGSETVLGQQSNALVRKYFAP